MLVTSAGLSGTADRELRERRYIVSQGLRMVCFLLAVVLPVPLWAKLLLMVGAFTLPWMGVVAANAGPTVQRKRARAPGVTPAEPLAGPVLGPGRTIDQEP